MFDPVRSSLLDTFSGVDDAGVAAAIGVAAREENSACARRLEAMGELYARRAPDDDDERISWLIDGHESLTAEVAAELGISRGRARGQLRYAIALREKLPRVMAVFLTGAIDMRLVIAMVNRTGLVDDEQFLARLDAALARCSPKWMRLSGPKLDERIDWWVDRIDPEGRRVAPLPPPDRYVVIWPSNSGLAGVDAQLRATDGLALDKRLDALADTVCANDPRPREVRRGDAFGALAAGLSELRCECNSPQCDAARRPAGTNVVVHVMAEQSSLDGSGSVPGYVSGYGPLPAPMVAELKETAKLKPLTVPEPSAAAEAGYRPSAALAEFVRWRDLTCRFPGCDKPAEVCDIDHTVPWPVGPTHPSNLKLLCRAHHLLKTFWTGRNGWNDEQFPDGTVEWRSPSGRVYPTGPGGAMFFPGLSTPTGEFTIGKQRSEPASERTVMMPRRARTRAQDRQARIDAERQINQQRLKRERWLFEEARRRQEANDPPPF